MPLKIGDTVGFHTGGVTASLRGGAALVGLGKPAAGAPPLLRVLGPSRNAAEAATTAAKVIM